MRTREEINKEIAKVNTAKRNAERKHARCVERLNELKSELRESEASDGNGNQ